MGVSQEMPGSGIDHSGLGSSTPKSAVLLDPLVSLLLIAIVKATTLIFLIGKQRPNTMKSHTEKKKKPSRTTTEGHQQDGLLYSLGVVLVYVLDAVTKATLKKEST